MFASKGLCFGKIVSAARLERKSWLCPFKMVGKLDLQRSVVKPHALPGYLVAPGKSLSGFHGVLILILNILWNVFC